MWIIGGSLPENNPTSRDGLGTLISGPTERITMSIPISVKKKNTDKRGKDKDYQKHTKEVCTWVLPIRDTLNENENESGTQSNNAKLLKNNFEIISERFLCMSSGYSKFSKELFQAKKRKILESTMEAETGPRTIAQVRRENKKNEQEHVHVLTGDQKNERNENRIDGNLLEDIDIKDPNLDEKSNLFDKEHSSNLDEKCSVGLLNNLQYEETLGVPWNSNDVARIENDNDSVTIGVYWTYKIDGKYIRGMSSMAGQSLLPEILNKENILINQFNGGMTVKNNFNNNININTTQNMNFNINSNMDSNLHLNKNNKILNLNRDAIDYVSLGLNHVRYVNITKKQKNVFISVTLEIQNNYSENLIICAEVLDKKRRTSSSTDFGSNNSISLNSNSNSHINNDKNSFYQIQKGLRWEKKLNFVDIELKPYELKKIDFTAVISLAGMYALNR